MNRDNDRGPKPDDARTPRGSGDFERRRYFGRRLRQLRENYSERIYAHTPASERPRMRPRITALALVECMQNSGTQISQAAFSDIENGINVPRDGGAFLEAITACLQLTDEEVRDLEMRLAHDILYPRLGPRTDELIKPRPGWDD